MKKNYTIHVTEISNSYEYGIEIYAYSPAQKRCNKQMKMYNACNPACKEEYYSLSFLYDDFEEEDAEWIKEETIDQYIIDYATLNDIDLKTAKILDINNNLISGSVYC